MDRGSMGEEVSVRMEEHPPVKRLKILCDIIKARESLPSLADDVIDHILSFLTIKEATKTSILSKRFEKSWQQNQNLSFDYMFSHGHSRSEIASIINRVLTLHSGKNIQRFHLCVNPYGLETMIYSWLELAMAKKPRDLDLDFLMGKYNVEPFEIPFEILDVDFVHSLRLSYCLIFLPPKFKGLHFLQTLVLRRIRLNSFFIQTIVDNCLLLKTLDIVKCSNLGEMTIVTTTLQFFSELMIGECYQLKHIFVNAPTLRVFHCVGKLQEINFHSTMLQLKDVALHFKPVSHGPPRLRMRIFMLNISHVRVLTITSTLLEDLCSTFVHGHNVIGPKQYLWHLKEVQLLMETTSFCNPYDIVCFIDKCPLLEKLFIDFQKFSFDGKSQYWELHDRDKFDHYDKIFSFLKLIKLSCFKFNYLELKLVKFLLQKAPNLENFALFTTKDYQLEKASQAVQIFTQHMYSWRSSPRAKVGVYEYYDKENDVLAPTHPYLWYDHYE